MVTRTDDNPIVVAGAGIAGMTCALAFAARGFPVELHERTPRMEEVGAGLQISPNASRLLERLGVLPILASSTVRPDAIVLRKASTLAQLACIPLGDFAERRWGAPYLVAHRADLQSALLKRVEQEPLIRMHLNSAVRDFALLERGVTASVRSGGADAEAEARMLVAADGVWSEIRGLAGNHAKSLFIGKVAWRTTVQRDSAAGQAWERLFPEPVVTAFLHGRFHLIAYPVRGGAAINLVAFTKGTETPEHWATTMDDSSLHTVMQGAAPSLAALCAVAGPWSAWPVHVADLDGAWMAPGGLALIGDAAHAMTPFAAQGAAMAIEDAFTLAEAVADNPASLETVLPEWNRVRRRRVLRVARRGAFNAFVWNAAGPVAFARDLVLRARPAEKLAADLDWLYGWKP